MIHAVIDTNVLVSALLTSKSDTAVFYEVALSKEDSYVVTGNLKHFPKTPIVVNPAQIMEILRKTQ